MNIYIFSQLRFNRYRAPTPAAAKRNVTRRYPQLHRTAIVVIWSVLITFLTSTGWAQANTNPAQNDKATLEETWGVQIVGIKQTAAGHMLDFRYRVVDPVKAAPLFVRQTAPYLIDQASGKSLAVPNMAKVGPLRSSNQPQEGRTYWMFFGNPGLVKAGNKVSVVIGDFKVENLTVQ